MRSAPGAARARPAGAAPDASRSSLAGVVVGPDPRVDHARGGAVLAPYPRALDRARRDAADPRRDLDRLPDGDLDERPARHLLGPLRVGGADGGGLGEGPPA